MTMSGLTNRSCMSEGTLMMGSSTPLGSASGEGSANVHKGGAAIHRLAGIHADPLLTSEDADEDSELMTAENAEHVKVDMEVGLIYE